MRVLHLLLDLLEHLLHSPQLEGSRAGIVDGAKPQPRSSRANGARAEQPRQRGIAKSWGGGALGCTSRPCSLEQQLPAGCRKGGS